MLWSPGGAVLGGAGLELQETTHCEQDPSSISCNVTSAALAKGFTAFVFLIFCLFFFL